VVRTVLVPLALLATVGSATAVPPDAAAHFEKAVRPVLVEKCLSCHGPEKQKGGLRLDSRAALLAGGDRGSALVPGKPEESLLLHALAHDGELKMPPRNKLPAADIAAIRDWIRAGAPWPEAGSPTVAPRSGERSLTAEEKAFWAFQPVRKPAVPATPGRTAHPIDAFLAARLATEGLTPAPPADRRTLLRRITFDLIGLPPTPEEFDAFLKDTSPDAYEKVVDRLLASPHYGEKWGRRWLDVARYADSNGMDENLAYVNAWRYRDYVIRSFNADKPYDQFVREQIAGDLLPGGTDAERVERLTATGFLVIGPKMLAEDDPVKMRMDIIDEQLDTIGQTFLGLTLGCARCHDHKFDPITMQDYYGLAGIFYSTKTMRNYTVVAEWHERPIAPPEVLAAAEQNRLAISTAQSVATSVEKTVHTAVGGVGASALALQQRARIAALQKSQPVVEHVMAVEDGTGENLKVHLRGNHLTLGDVAPRRFPKILADTGPLPIGADRSGRRELAEWLTRPDHPLTARVMVNRVWAGHFGTGLVRSTDNFGKLGERPSHPELLDWLAAEFVANGWSLKRLHRLIVTSAAYRMSSRPDPAAVEIDPDNRLLAYFPRRRLDAEELRDGLLAVSGLLDRTAGGSLLKAKPRQYVTGTANSNYEGYQHLRRSVYLPVIRSAVYDVLHTFDFPDPSVPNGQRTTTTIPTQALFLLNGELVDQAATALAQAVLEQPAGDDSAHIRLAYRRVHGRDPTPAEQNKVLAYLKVAVATDATLPASERQLRAWRGLCRVLLASNEFVFVE